MKTIICIFLITLVAADYQYETIGAKELIDEVNNSNAGWVAGENQFTGMKHEEIKKTRLGLKRSHHMNRPSNIEKTLRDAGIQLPKSFDSRQKWPNCVHKIRDQAQCGSCWAFSASEVLSDRWCIETNGKTNEVLSPQDMISCSDANMGCEGGRLGAAWNFMCKYGLVEDSCYPYTSAKGDSGSCSWKTCTAKGQSWVPKTSTHYNTFTTVSAIKAEIYAHGPIQTGFTVYEDFMSYKSGVYKHTTGGALGGHAVKIVGWGETDQNVPYWIVANSWNTSWGLDGYFWMGMNGDCGFEAQGTAGQANTAGSSPSFWCYLPF